MSVLSPMDSYGREAPMHAPLGRLDELSEEVKGVALSVGVDTHGAARSGSYFQLDHSVLYSASGAEGVEVLSIGDALDSYPWLADYHWGLVDPEADEYTREARAHPHQGYFIRAQEGAKAGIPLQACLYMGEEGLAQNVHNVIIAEAGSELHVITGCATARHVSRGLHIGVSEFYVRRGARLTFTMIHSWGPEVVVRPRSVTRVEDGGTFLSTYVCMRPVGDLQMYPTVYCGGGGAVARLNSMLYAGPGVSMDIGGRVILDAPGGAAEIVSRAISDGGSITARGHLIGRSRDIKAHLECRGLILGEGGGIHAIPELEAHAPGLQMSHEAAVGKIAEEEIQYLMARGMTTGEATAAIVRGFLDIEIKGLPEGLREEIRRCVSQGGGL